MEKDRVTWIDDVRGLCVFCVLLAHTGIQHPYLYKLYTPFFLTTFFFISGFLYKNTNLKNDILKIFRHLFLPYLWLNAILIIVGIDNWNAIFQGNYNYVLSKIKDTVLGYNMWFIPCIIMVQLYVTILYHIFMKTIICKLLVAICLLFTVFFIKNENGSFLPWYADTALFSSSFFLLGNIVKMRIGFSNWFPNLKLNKWFSLGVLMGYICIAYLMQSVFNMEFHYAYNYYDNPLCFILLALIGIFTVCVFFQINHFRLFNICGKNSLAFFAFNGKAKALALIILPNVLYVENHISVLFLSLIESFILICISFFINKYCPFIIGKYKIK